MSSVMMKTRDRVTANTDPAVNERIRRRAEERLWFYEQNPDLIPRRLRELDEEWDIERSLETASSSISLFGLAMAVLSGRRWLVLPLLVQGFFLQHGIQGWCPPLPALRKMGVRTQEEIEDERRRLLALQERATPVQRAAGAPRE